jgi:hypothetical protein
VDLADGAELSTRLHGTTHMDVASAACPENALRYHAHKKGLTSAQVHLVDEASGEFLYYEVRLTASAPGVLGTLPKQAPVRQLHMHAVPVHNPLDVEVAFEPKCTHAEVLVPPRLVVPPRSTASCPSSGGRQQPSPGFLSPQC